MNSGSFTKVFDVIDSGFKNWTFSASGLIFVAVGIVLFFSPKIIQSFKIPNMNAPRKFQRFFKYYFLGFAIIWTTTTFFTTFSQYKRHLTLAKENGCRVIEGAVENFVPMPYSGHAEESFSVSGVQFRYSDYIVTDGFNNTSSHGGPITKDSYVRICYDPADNQILRLEIRDFKGQIKDYSKVESPLPDVTKNPAFKEGKSFSDIPWYFGIYVLFYALDFFAIFILYKPYLSTFFRIKTAPLKDFTIPQSLNHGVGVKLRNGLLYWDKENRTIWMRPRGLNMIQIQLLVAKFNVDKSNQNIVSQEIRFSSGIPFLIATFAWPAYQFFSKTSPAETNALPPTQIIIVGGAFLLIGGYINLRILKTRMEALIQDVLTELREM